MSDAFELIQRVQGGQRQLALVRGGKLLEYYMEDTDAHSLVGSVFLGRVERVLPDIKAAFVKLGLPLNGFLPIQEAESYHRTCGAEPLLSGNDVLVQVKKDAKGGKGAYLTRDIALPGQYVLLMPKNRFVGVSKRITDSEAHKQAKQLGQRIADGRFGVIVRHAALYARLSEVQDEAEMLYQLWQSIEARATHAKAPLLLHREPDMLETLCNDYAARHTITVRSTAQPSERSTSGVCWETLSQVALEAAWEGAHIDRQINEALKRRVELPGGGTLIIDEREALSTIDVNSGSHVMRTDDRSLALSENLRAVPEIARQIQLRNLSGILLVDFIDMDTEAERTQVMEAMQLETSDDRVKTVIHGFTSLGLLEMTRKRTRDTLRDLLTEPCTACRESGRIRRAPNT